MWRLRDKYGDYETKEFNDNQMEELLAKGLVPDLGKEERQQVMNILNDLKTNGICTWVDMLEVEHSTNYYEHRGFIYTYMDAEGVK